jgi:redox-sensing transcriptional repressor
LGSALLAYSGLKKRGFDIVAVFDNDLTKIGKTWEGVIIQDISNISKIIKDENIRLAIVAVPVPVFQEVTDMLVSGGVRAILNFAPARINVPEGVKLRNVDLASELECLSYFLTNEAGVRTAVANRQ